MANGSRAGDWPDSNRDGVPDVKQHQNAAAALNDFGIIYTGVDGEGSGCTLSSARARPDPMLLWLMLSAIVAIGFRRIHGRWH